MGQSLGNKFKITFAGESHGPGYTVIIEGYPSNRVIDYDLIQKELDQRKPGQNQFTTERKENDHFQILSGVFEGKSTGAPLTLFIPNKDQNSKDYSKIKDLARPGHADKVLIDKYNNRDYRGGGWSSARMTATWVAAGALAQELLKEKGIQIFSYTHAIGEISQQPIIYEEISKAKWDPELYSLANSRTEQMKELIERVRSEGDSIGGQCRVIALGIPKNLGAPFADSLKSKIAQYFFSGPAITALEFGSGIEAARMKGSEHNDSYERDGSYKTNYHGGIQAGISTGNPLDLMITLKAPSSISKEQELLNYQTGILEKFSIKGRHDPCVVPRYCAVAKSLLALSLADSL